MYRGPTDLRDLPQEIEIMQNKILMWYFLKESLNFVGKIGPTKYVVIFLLPNYASIIQSL